MLPWIIVAVVAVPILVVAFVAVRRSNREGEHPPGETAAQRRREEQEFEDAERYQAQWRKEQHTHQDDTRIP